MYIYMCVYIYMYISFIHRNICTYAQKNVTVYLPKKCLGSTYVEKNVGKSLSELTQFS